MNNNTLRPIKITLDDLVLINKFKNEYDKKKKDIIAIILNEIKKELENT